MKKNTVIEVKNLGKRYEIKPHEEYLSFRESLVNFIKNIGQLRKKDKENNKSKFWALKNVSFKVEKGEIVGIIGRNAAGKSTLLKILSQIVEPTEGMAILKGKVSSILEIGAGFHTELTGRENIYLKGVILGMDRREIDKKFRKIVQFSGIDKKFLDIPVKKYSDGMYVRLAFAIVAHLTTEILLSDEVLAVGDTEFQEKCLGKLKEEAKKGRTILFVSHDMGTITKLCSKVILLENGKIKKIGIGQEIADLYLSSLEK